MTIPETATISQNERTAARVVNGRAVVISIDEQRLHTLNPVGTHIWELLSESRTLAAIVDSVIEEFDVERDRALEDARAFVERLCSVGALEIRKENE